MPKKYLFRVLLIAAGILAFASGAEALPDQPAPVPGPGEATPVTSTLPFSGTITAKTDDLLSVDTDAFQLTADTTWVFGGSPTTDIALFDAGDIVLVRATRNGGALTAHSVTMMANLVSDEGVTPDAAPPTATFAGPIEARSSSGLTVEGTVLLTDDRTVWRVDGAPTKDLSHFDLGDQVVVQAAYQGQDWVATDVNLVLNAVRDAGPQEKPATAQVFTGQIQAITANAVSLNETTFAVEADTQWRMSDGTIGNPDQFHAGDTVQVIAARRDTGWTALRITMLK